MNISIQRQKSTYYTTYYSHTTIKLIKKIFSPQKEHKMKAKNKHFFISFAE